MLASDVCQWEPRGAGAAGGASTAGTEGRTHTFVQKADMLILPCLGRRGVSYPALRALTTGIEFTVLPSARQRQSFTTVAAPLCKEVGPFSV